MQNHDEQLMIMRSPKVISHGTWYEKNSVILLETSEFDLPVLGLIKGIYIISETIFFYYRILRTQHFDEMLIAYNVVPAENQFCQTIALTNLRFPHTIPKFVHKNLMYVLLLYHDMTEFYG